MALDARTPTLLQKHVVPAFLLVHVHSCCAAENKWASERPSPLWGNPERPLLMNIFNAWQKVCSFKKHAAEIHMKTYFIVKITFRSLTPGKIWRTSGKNCWVWGWSSEGAVGNWEREVVLWWLKAPLLLLVPTESVGRLWQGNATRGINGDIYFWLHGTDLIQATFQFFMWSINHLCSGL